MIRFVCGCSHKLDLGFIEQISEDELEMLLKHGTLEEAFTKYLSTFDGITQDAEGFIVCSDHEARRQGWRSVPYVATRADVAGMGGWTPLEYERFMLVGVRPSQPVVKINSVAPDFRDNRDPQEIGSSILFHKSRDKRQKPTSEIADYIAGSPQ